MTDSMARAIAAADAAQAAFPAWSALGPNARRALLNAAADVIEARADAFVDAMREELRASEPWARFNVQLGAGMVREAAALTTQITGEVIPSDKPGLLSLAAARPVTGGVERPSLPQVLLDVLLGCESSQVAQGHLHARDVLPPR